MRAATAIGGQHQGEQAAASTGKSRAREPGSFDLKYVMNDVGWILGAGIVILSGFTGLGVMICRMTH